MREDAGRGEDIKAPGAALARTDDVGILSAWRVP